MFNKLYSVICLGIMILSLNCVASPLNQADMSYAFNQSVSIKGLTDAELSAIEGEWLFLVPVITSAVSYTATSVVAGNFAWGGLAWAAGSGLFGGGVYGSVGRALAPSIGIGRFGFVGLGSGIGFGLNYSNPWKKRFRFR